MFNNNEEIVEKINQILIRLKSIEEKVYTFELCLDLNKKIEEIQYQAQKLDKYKTSNAEPAKETPIQAAAREEQFGKFTDIKNKKEEQKIKEVIKHEKSRGRGRPPKYKK